MDNNKQEKFVPIACDHYFSYEEYRKRVESYEKRIHGN